MTQKVFKNEFAKFSIKHRAECKKHSYTGNWHSEEEDAYIDAEQHRAEYGGETHNLKVITEQKQRLITIL